MQGEIQEYHRGQLEKDGIFLPPREATVLTISGNFTQKDLDKAAKKGTKRQSYRNETIADPTIENSETKQITYQLNLYWSVILR